MSGLPSRRPALSGHTQVVGVIGWPIAHSVSPAMHDAAFEALGLDWCYVPFPVPPARLGEAIAGARALGVRGLNATIPHKQALLSLVDDLTPAARAIGAVNTIAVRGERLLGHNTDAGGFLRALREAGFAPEGCRALVLGAGGAARAVVYALLSVGGRVTLLNRTLERAAALAHEFAGLFPRDTLTAGVLDAATLGQVGITDGLIVNATSLGMWPAVDTSPWPEEARLSGSAFVFDLVYNPRTTRLMRQAQAAGARAVDGLGMLVHQGAEAFALWTGVEPPVEVMYAACTALLGAGSGKT